MSSTALAELRRPVHQTLPTMYDLPSEEIGESGMPDEFHPHQAVLLSETFYPTTVAPDQFFTAMDLNLYYDAQHPLLYKRPDWFAAIGVPRFYKGRDLRMSYVVWQEGVAPLLIVELLSEKTQKEDLGQTTRDVDGTPTKWAVYERILRVPYYAVFSRLADRLRVFRMNGGGYTEVICNGNRCWIPEAGLGLGVWRGPYNGATRLWLRWYDAANNWIPTREERAVQAELHAEQAQLHAEQAQLHAEQAQLHAEQVQWNADRAEARAGQAEERADQAEERADQAQLHADQARLHADQARLRAEQEQLRANQTQIELDRERERAARMAELLRQLGQDPDRI
jgi:Uma2 family endonuclease